MFVPFLVSEREAGGWEDCVWASGVMFANGVRGADLAPATRAEYEALRVAGGDGPAENPGDGSRLSQLAAGLRARYGLEAFRLGNGWTDLLAAAPVGTYIALNGDTSALPPRLQASTFRGPHTFLVCRDARLSGLVLDPLRVNGAPAVRANLDELHRYHDALAGAAWLASTASEVPNVSTTVYVLPFGGDLVIPADTEVTGFRLDGPGGTVGTTKVWEPHPLPSSAPYDARMFTDATRGDPFLRVTAGYFDGFYVQEAAVQATDREAPDSADAVLSGRRIEWARWAAALNIPTRPDQEV